MQYIWFTTVSVVSELSLPQMLIQVASASVLYFIQYEYGFICYEALTH